MGNAKFFITLAFTAMTLGACSSDNKSNSSAGQGSAADTTTPVTEADSTHSFRNDRGTDSATAGKTIPAKP